jgi:hypothetical protein
MTTKKQRGGKHNKTKKNILTASSPLICNPNIDEDSVVRGSCFPNKILTLLKQSYNENNPDNQITSEKPRLIWKDLKNRLRTCTNEECWLHVIKDVDLREKIDKYLFIPRPLQPNEWNSDPNTWLSNIDIDEVLGEYEKSYPSFKAIKTATIDFDDICYVEDLCKLQSKDKLEDLLKLGKRKIGVVFNLDKMEESGSHWVSLFIDLQDNFMFYFDSNGDKIPKEIKSFMERIKSFAEQLENPIYLQEYDNYKVQHQYENTECGMYSLFFIITMLTNKINNVPIKSYKDKIQLFREPRIPDNYVSKFRKIYFKI